MKGFWLLIALCVVSTAATAEDPVTKPQSRKDSVDFLMSETVERPERDEHKRVVPSLRPMSRPSTLRPYQAVPDRVLGDPPLILAR